MTQRAVAPRNEGLPPLEPVSHAGGAKSDATANILVKHANGTAKLPRVIILNRDRGKFHLAGELLQSGAFLS